MATQILTPEQKEAATSILRVKFFIFVHIGALMICMTSFHPFFAAHNIPGAIILILSIIYDHWVTASKKAKRLMVYPSLLLTTWVQLNIINHWIMPTPELTDAALKIGFIGSILVIVGCVSALREIRMMD